MGEIDFFLCIENAFERIFRFKEDFFLRLDIFCWDYIFVYTRNINRFGTRRININKVVLEIFITIDCDLFYMNCVHRK